MDSKDILILGASSRVAILMKPILEANPQVSISWQTRQIQKNISHEWIDLLVFPLLNLETSMLESSINLKQYNTVVCLAGAKNQDDECLSLNTEIARSALNIAERVRAERLLFFSSSAVYEYGEKLSEFDNVYPQNKYGASKLAAEEYLYEASSSVSVLCLRVANVICADSITARYIWEEEPTALKLDIFSDKASITRSFIDPKALAEIIIKLSCEDHGLSGPVNVASVETVDLIELLKMIDVKWTGVSRVDSQRQRITLATDKLRGAISGFGREMTLKSIASQFYQNKLISHKLRLIKDSFQKN